MPTVAYAAYMWKLDKASVEAPTRDEEAAGDGETPSEQSPLLGR